MNRPDLRLDPAMVATIRTHGVLPVLHGMTNELVAYLVVPHALPEPLRAAAKPTDVRDLPRAARPKHRLSKRQRDIAKREKLNIPIVAPG